MEPLPVSWYAQQGVSEANAAIMRQAGAQALARATRMSAEARRDLAGMLVEVPAAA